MLNMNRVELIGNLGRDAEIRDTSNGGKIAILSVATTDRWRKDGEQQSRTDWHMVKVLSPKLVEIVQQYARKGVLVRIEGRLHQSSYEKNGERRYSTEIVLGARSTFSLLSKPASNNAEPEDAPAAQPEAPALKTKINSDDIPF